MSDDPLPDKEKFNRANKRAQSYMRYSAIGFQMMGIILVGVYGGYYLDKKLEWNFPVFTLTLSLAGIGGAMYFLFKETSRNS